VLIVFVLVLIVISVVFIFMMAGGWARPVILVMTAMITIFLGLVRSAIIMFTFMIFFVILLSFKMFLLVMIIFIVQTF